MKASTLALLAGTAIASPVPAKRQVPAGIDDAVILNYALTLEHLENKFYKEALENYTEADFAAAGHDTTFYNNLKMVSSEEQTHVDFLTSALTAAGATPVKEATYAFPATDVPSFLALSQVLEGVGISAYLGAAGDIMSKTYLGAAASILTVEGRHSAFIRGGNKLSPFPSAFDIALDFNEVYTLAAMFITGFAPGDVALPFKAFPTLTASPSNTATPACGSSLQFDLESADILKDVVSGAWISATGPVFVPVTWYGATATVTVPEGIYGQSYFVLTNSKDTVSDDTIVAGPVIVETAPEF